MHLGGTDIELVTGLPGAAEGPLQRQLQRGEGMFMAALTVRDPAAAVAMLREHGNHGDGRRAGRVHLAAEYVSDEAAALGRVGTRTASRSGAMWPRSQRLA